MSKTEKIMLVVALIISCLVLCAVNFSIGWDAIPENQKGILLKAGIGICAILWIAAAAYCTYFFYSWACEIKKAEAEEYEKRMANQFNVGSVITPNHYLDRSDYLKFARGRK